MSKFVELQPDVVVAEGTEADEAKGVKAVPPLTWSLEKGVEYVLDHADAFDRPASHQRAGRRIMKAFRDAIAKKATHAELKDEDWASFAAVTEAAEVPWGIWSYRQHDDKGQVIGATPMDVPKRKFLHWTDAVSEALNDESYSKLMDARRAAEEKKDEDARPIETGSGSPD